MSDYQIFYGLYTSLHGPDQVASLFQTGSKIPKPDLPLYADSLKMDLEELLNLAQDRFKICVENYAVGLTELALLQPYLEPEQMFLCFDLVKGVSQLAVASYHLSHPEWIKQVHLHDRREDASYSARGHRVIASGDIDFSGYIGLLIEKGEVEDYCIEVHLREKVRESLLALGEIIRNMDVEKSSRSRLR